MAHEPEWNREGAAWRAEMPNGVTLIAAPEHVTGVLGDKPKRGTAWRACVSREERNATAGGWTISRFGRDTWRDMCRNVDEAKRLAESVYREAIERAA